MRGSRVSVAAVSGEEHIYSTIFQEDVILLNTIDYQIFINRKLDNIQLPINENLKWI